MIEDNKQFMSAIAQIAEEKGISQDKILETIEAAIAAAYKKDYAQRGQDIRAKFDLSTGKVEVFQVKEIVDKESLKTEEGEEREINPDREVMIEDVKKKNAKVGDEIKFKLKPHDDYGRIAAQTAKQVIIQKIREAEKQSIYDDFKDKESEVVSGIIQRIENNNVFVDIGRTSGILFPSEQISGERYRIGQRLKVYIVKINEDLGEQGIVLSRTYPEIINKLFAIEVPEIASGTVEIKAVAREPGSRSKVAVVSKEEGIDPIGSLVGQKGTRVQTVINELCGEMIDIVQWDEDSEKFIANALSPAKVTGAKLKKTTKQAKITVPEDQLSLAIGKKGQNVRLAAKLTGWKIDVVGEGEKEGAKIKKNKIGEK